MTNKVIVFINPHFTLGGVDTYFYRMIKWLSARDIRTILLLTKNAKVDEKMVEEVKQLGTQVRMEIEPYPLTGEMSPTHIRLNLEPGTEVTTITTRYAGFFQAQQLKIDNPQLHFTFMNYMTHEHGFKADIEPLDKNKMGIAKYSFHKVRYQFYKNLTEKVFQSKELYFQNDIHRYSLYDYYHMDHSETMGPNIHLGIDIPELDEEAIKKRCDRKAFSILTIARFEFPFKGYLLQLVEQFAELCGKYDNLELTIIGGGPDEQRLLDKIAGLPEKAQRKIHLPGYVDYERLKEYFSHTSLYVGQGTTVLDAGKQGLLAVPVSSYTEESTSYSYLYEYVEIYAPEPKYKTSHFIEKTIHMSDEEYIEASKKTYENVKKEMDLNNVMPQILAVKNAERRYEMSQWKISLIKKINMLIQSRH